MKTWKLFINIMKVLDNKCPVYFLGIIMMSSSWAMFTVMSSLLVKGVVDVAQYENTQQIFLIIMGNVLGGIIALLVYWVAAVVYNIEAKRAYGVICRNVFHHEIRLPYSYYEKNHSGNFMSKLSYDLQKMGSIYGSRLRRTVAPILQVIVYLVPMFIMSWHITLCLIGVNCLMFIINSLMISPIKKCSKKLSQINSNMTEKLMNLLHGMEQARMNTAGKHTVLEFVVENEKYAQESKKKIIYSAILESCSCGFDLLCALAFLMVGLYFVKSGYTTLGALSAIYSLYSGFSSQFLLLGRYLPELIGCFVNAQNIFDFLSEPEEPQNWYEKIDNKELNLVENIAPTKKKNFNVPVVVVDKIKFSYHYDKSLIKDYYMEVRNGESVAISGSSGCGKTTLSKLLLSLYPVECGDIIIEGKSYRKLTNSEIRKKYSYVSQEPYLFNESVRENIRIGKLDATDEEVENAAKIAYAHDFIMKLENGYDTKVGERGNCLSGGQRQRIAIARAIIKNAPVILLDEATSALDNESERLVNEALKSLKNRNTIIMIAHRSSTIALADREIVMNPC